MRVLTIVVLVAIVAGAVAIPVGQGKLLRAKNDMAKAKEDIAKGKADVKAGQAKQEQAKALGKEASALLAKGQAEKTAGQKEAKIAEKEKAVAGNKFVSCERWTTGKQHYFRIVAGLPGVPKTMLTSEGYVSASNAARGFKSLTTGSHKPTCTEGKAGAQKGKWRLTVGQPKNGQVTGTGEGYVNKAGCENAGNKLLQHFKTLSAVGYTGCKQVKA